MCASLTADGASPPRRRTPTAPTPSYAALASARTPSSRPGASCENSVAAPGRPANWPRPSMSFKPARSQDEKPSLAIPDTGGLGVVPESLPIHDHARLSALYPGVVAGRDHHEVAGEVRDR